MKCARCGNEIPESPGGTRFCPSCGQPVSPAGREIREEPMPRKSLGIWAGVAGVLIVALIVAVIWLARGRSVTQAPTVQAPPQSPVANAPSVPGNPQPGVLQSDVNKPPLDLEKPARTPPPKEVLDYLAHLERVEKARIALKERQESQLFEMMKHVQLDPYKQVFSWMEEAAGAQTKEEPLPQEQATRAMTDLSREWQSLARQFVSVSPPQPCQTLAEKYYDALRDVISSTGAVQAMLNKGDVTPLLREQGKSGHIDEKFTASDQELAAVCSKYGIQKPFSIQSDAGMSPLSGLMPKQ